MIELKLAELAREGDWAMRIVHCPLITSDMPEAGQRTAEHTDFGLFTLLPDATAPGFEWRDQSGRWHDVGSRADGLLVNVGDLLTRRAIRKWAKGPARSFRFLGR